MKPIAAMAGGLMLAACGGEVARPATVGTVAPIRPPAATTGLERVMGHDAAQLTRSFGEPVADIREGTARKLQFAGPICVMDAYLYPGEGHEPVVTHIDARQPDGSPIDRASCIAALSHRAGGQ